MNNEMKRTLGLSERSTKCSPVPFAPRGGSPKAPAGCSDTIQARVDFFQYEADSSNKSSGVSAREAKGRGSEQETLAIVFQKFGPYHIDRIVAAKRIIGEKMRVVGIEISDGSTTYDWDRAQSNGFERITLFPGESWESIKPFRRMVKILSCLRRIKATHVLLINYQFMDIFFSAVALRFLGKRPYIMMASKFTDKERKIGLEKLKRFLFVPYLGGITSGESHLSYLNFLGVRTTNFHTGLDTLSAERVRTLASCEPAPYGEPFHDRHFTIIARMVPEKDIPTAIHAYARYLELCRERGMPARDLVLCGDGPERGEIERLVGDYGIDSVTFRGFLQEREVCESLATTVALVLPSLEEPWGLVINEAVAMGVPILCSNVCGACDDLVRAGVNGFVFSPGEVEGLAHLMMMVSSHEEEWQRLSMGSLLMAPRADASRFGRAVASALQIGSQDR